MTRLNCSSDYRQHIGCSDLLTGWWVTTSQENMPKGFSTRSDSNRVVQLLEALNK